MKHLRSVEFKDGKFSVIDQLKLPNELVYISINNSEDAWRVIRDMNVRGAPLIAIVAAIGLSVDLRRNQSTFENSVTKVTDFILDKSKYLRTSRPTAAPLFNIMDKLDAYVLSMKDKVNAIELVDLFCKAAEAELHEDIAFNRTMAMHGADYIQKLCGNRQKIRVLTICNTGSLATGGYGTALGVIRMLHERGALEHVYACETRPYNQGARLTAFEIVHDGLPGTLIPDSSASALIAVKGVDVVVVGGDRVTANGDLANKIGTYQLAISAHYHNVPFFTAVATSVVDCSLACGASIVIEQRPALELTSLAGIKLAPEGINVWNPGFDVTPSSLIHGIITEVGVATHKNSPGDDDASIIDMVKYIKNNAGGVPVIRAGGVIVKPIRTPLGYTRFAEDEVLEYLINDGYFCKLLGISYTATNEEKKKSLTIEEVGDGNINFVYIVKGPAFNNPTVENPGSVVVKQALPFVRCVGEDWPLTLDRAKFEANALQIEYDACKGKHVPKVYRFDESKCLIAMEYVRAPHVILRKVLMSKEFNNSFAAHVGEFCAFTLFSTSALALSGAQLRENVTYWSRNSGMCGLTEQVIFTDPYYPAKFNHCLPELENVVKVGVYCDDALKLAVSVYKAKFLELTQALLHGDLHSGSVMVDGSQNSTYVIDPEFAFYGPIGFDLGLFVANLLCSYCSHVLVDPVYAEWILKQLLVFYECFHENFLKLWRGGNAGDAYNANVFTANTKLMNETETSFMRDVWSDTLGFAGCEIIRRIVGIAHVADLDKIEDSGIRAKSQLCALLVGRSLIVDNLQNCGNINLLLELAKQISLAVNKVASVQDFHWPK